jgi:hypothetical protein
LFRDGFRDRIAGQVCEGFGFQEVGEADEYGEFLVDEGKDGDGIQGVSVKDEEVGVGGVMPGAWRNFAQTAIRRAWVSVGIGLLG